MDIYPTMPEHFFAFNDKKNCFLTSSVMPSSLIHSTCFKHYTSFFVPSWVLGF